MAKLVRDRIPDIFELNEGRKPKTSRIPASRILEAAFDKLHEEVLELEEATTKEFPGSESAANRKAAIMAEAADVQEILEFVCFLIEIPMHEVRQAQMNKRNERGGFSRRISLDEE